MLYDAVTLVAHADWSKNEHKRWLAVANRVTDGGWIALTTRQVKNARNLLPTLRGAAGAGGCALVGFDFPIGLPATYAHKVAVTDFLEWLPGLGQGLWSEFFQVAEHRDQINLYRPFYPYKSGGAKRIHLVQKLGVNSFDDLRRLCEQAHPDRRAACPLFWTLGGQQVGKAAITGWQEMLIPGLLDDNINLALWPFSGPLVSLLVPGRVVIVETYPAEAYKPFGIRNKPGKRSQVARRANARTLLDFANKNEVNCTPELEHEILDGFGHHPDGEDRFDAWIGLLWMLYWLKRGTLPEPQDQTLIKLEGWIYGQQLITNP